MSANPKSIDWLYPKFNKKSKPQTTTVSLNNLYQAVVPTDYYLPSFDSLDINATTNLEGRALMEMARYVEANNVIAASILNRFEDVLVGETGITVESSPIKIGGEVDYELGRKLTHEWREFCTSPLVNNKGLDFRGALCHIVRAWLRDGDVFVHMITKKNPQKLGGVEFKIRIIEADKLGYNTVTYNMNSFTAPIEVDEYGTPTYYNFQFNQTFRATDYVRINQSEILTISNTRDASQLRGVSIFAPVLKDLSNILLYLETNLVNARIGTQILGDLSTVDPMADNGNSIEVNQLNNNVHILNIPAGKKLTMHSPVKTDSNLGDYMDTYLRAICGAVGIDYEGVARIYEGSFSSARLSVINSQKRARGQAEKLISCIVRPLFRSFIKFTLINNPNFKNINILDYENIYNANYQTDKLPNVDPLKEANANVVMLQSGQISPQALAKKNGQNFEELVMEWKQAEETLKHHGFNQDITPLTILAKENTNIDTSKSFEDDQDEESKKTDNQDNDSDNSNTDDKEPDTQNLVGTVRKSRKSRVRSRIKIGRL